MKKHFAFLSLILATLLFAHFRFLSIGDARGQEELYFLFSTPVLMLIGVTLFFMESLAFFTVRVNGAIEFRKDSMMARILKVWGWQKICSSFWAFGLMMAALAFFAVLLFFASIGPEGEAMTTAEIMEVVKRFTLMAAWGLILISGALRAFVAESYDMEDGQSLRRHRVKGYLLLTYALGVAVYVIMTQHGISGLAAAGVGLLGLGLAIALFIAGLHALDIFGRWFQKTCLGRAWKHFIEGSCPMVKVATE